MKIIIKLFKHLFIIFILLAISSPFWIKKIPLASLSLLTGKVPLADKYLCRYTVKVNSDSMEPVIPRGSSIKLNRCFTQNDLSEGTVVLAGKDEDYHLGIIRHVLPLNPVVYKISNERPDERLQDMIKEEIAAINKDIDTSRSAYTPVQDLESLMVDPDEYVSGLYLGKIPRGYGEEMAEVEKTDIFVKDSDKFCMVVVPKKELAFVDTEIVDARTNEAVVTSKNIVFNVRSQPNTNCQDFGTGREMLDLSQGTYRYRFLLNHQALADIPFTVK